jgi:integrase
MLRRAKSRKLYKKMDSWSRQFYLKKEKITPLSEIIEIAESIDNDRDRCLFILTYLTAGRLQEIVRYSRGGEKRSSIRLDDLNITEVKGNKVLLINLRNEKNLTKHRKDIPVPLNLIENRKLYNLMVDWLSSVEDKGEIFPISYPRAYKILTKINPDWNPHWLRHLRLTHLVTNYKYREHQLMLYAGWSDPRPAKNYLEMRWEDLLY